MGKNGGSTGEYTKFGGIWESMDGRGIGKFLVVR